MNDFGRIKGFEDLWRPVAGPRKTGANAALSSGGQEAKARLARVAARTPEVLVKITGRTRGADHARAHLNYISRDGVLPLEGRDGERLEGLAAIAERAGDWAADDDSRKRADASVSISIVLSMPAGTPAVQLRDAARAFAEEQFSVRHDYVFALHTDADHPHVHLAVRTLGEGGVRLNPRKADLDAWRQSFARHLRARDIAAEATPRRARGIVRKAERLPVRKLRERYERDPDRYALPRVYREAVEEAQRLASGMPSSSPWETAILRRQQAIRAALTVGAEALGRSPDPDDRLLARSMADFIKAMPPIATRKHQLVRLIKTRADAELGKANERNL